MADSHIRPINNINLGRAIQNVSNWATSLQTGLQHIHEQADTPQVPKVNYTHQTLSKLLTTEVFDIDAFGSVPDIINYRVTAGIEDASFLVTDLTSIVEQFDQWQRELPMVEPFYAMKCNPDPVIVRLLATLGCGFDCATKGEIELVTNGIGEELSFVPRGIQHDKIVYANPAKFQQHIEFAAEAGVCRTVFDGEDELYKLAKVNDKLPEGKKLELLLRITTDDANSVCSFSNKFGCPVAEGPALLKIAKELGLNVVGVSFHVGSGCGDPNAYSIAFDHAAKLFEAADELGMQKMNLVDIGGGFPGDNQGTYREDAPTFPKIAGTVRQAIKDFTARVNTDGSRKLRYIAEPGRYFVSRSTTIATKIYGRKGGKGKNQALYIDDGVYGSFNNVVYDHYHPVPVTLKSAIEGSEELQEAAERIPTAVFGPTCDGLDQICSQENTDLQRAQIGDWLIFNDMGAYTHTASFVFNGYTHIPKKIHCISTFGYDEDSSLSSDEGSPECKER